MATLNLWNDFIKRRNSTKQPAGTANLSLDVKLKENCSIANPVFIVSGNYFTANYAQFAGQYYFVDDVVSVHDGLCEIHCSKDVLATYKAEITASRLFVLYYTHSNTEIADRRLSTKTTKIITKNTGVFDVLGNGTGTNYAVVLNCIGENTCDSFVVNQATARDILSNLDNWFDNSGSYDPNTGSREGSGFLDWVQLSFNSVEESIESFLKETMAFWRQFFGSGKAADNLKSAYMLPLPVSAIGGNTADIWLGKYNTGINATRVTDRIFSDGCTVNIPWPANINDWRRNSPYLELFLYIPYVGLVTLSPSDLIGDASLNVSVSMDISSGDAVFTVYTDTNRFIGHYTTNMAAAFAIGTSNVNPAQMFNTLASAIASGASAAAQGNASGVVDAGLSLANTIAGNPTCIGSNAGGAVLGLTDQVVCYSVFHDTTIQPGDISAVRGTPFNGALTLSSIPSGGYVQTAGASVDMPGFGGDRDTVNSLLDGGIYIE